MVRVENVDEDFFEITAKNEFEAAEIVAKFVIQNDIVELDYDEDFVVEVEEIDDTENEEFNPDYSVKVNCEDCGEDLVNSLLSVRGGKII